MICTNTDTISIPVCAMYLHARMFCALAHISSTPMGAINFYIQERFFTLTDTTFNTHWYDVFAFKNVLYTRSYVFYSYGGNVRASNLFWACVAKLVLWQLMILLLCTLTHTSSIPMGAINSNSLIQLHQFLPWWPKFWLCANQAPC